MDKEDRDHADDSMISDLLAAAWLGDTDAMFSLAEAYRTGDHVPQDYSQALAWYQQAAEKGNVNAQNDLGSMYQNGMGTPEDSKQAAHWYRLAAEQGHSVAQFNLALRYLHGDGVPLNLENAVQWLCKAVEQGHVEATGQLGTLFRFGQGVERNIVSAAELHVVAASEGDVTSMGNLVDYQDEIEQAALSGSVLAAVCLAKIHDQGITVPKNQTQAWAWLQWALRHGTKDNDADVQEELHDWVSFEEMFVSDEIRQQAQELLVQMEKRAIDASHE